MNRVWRQPGRWPRLVILVACAALVVMYWRNDDNAGQPDAPRGTGEYLPILDRGDGHMLYLMARSTALDLDWDFENDLAEFGDPWLQQTNEVTGRKEIPHPIGPPLVWTPLIWVAEVGAVIGNVFGADIPLHGYTEWHQRFVFLFSTLAAIAAVLLGRRLAQRLIGGEWAPTYAALAILLGTSITYYATYMPSYGHGLDAGVCAVFLAVWVLTLGRWEWRRWVVLGALLGIAMLIRTQDIAFGVVIVVEVIAQIIGNLRRRAIDWRMRALLWIGGGAITLAVALVVFSPQLLYWHVIYGDAFTLPQGSRYTRLDSPMILELLYSARNGWFATHPIAYFAVIGLACLPKRSRMVAIALFLALALQVYLNSTIIDWWGMASFGQRRLCSVTAILVVGMAALLWRLGRLAARVPRIPRVVWHVLAVVVLGCFIAWNIWRVRAYKGGKAAPNELDPTCCQNTPKWARYEMAWIYRRIGNPFQFPANVLFALEHEVELQRWDKAVGYYALVPPAHSLRDNTMYDYRGGWRLGFPLAEPYLIGAWSGVALGANRSFRWTLAPMARALVPNLMPEPQRFTLVIGPGGGRHVTVRWNGTIVARTELVDDWQTVTWDVHDMDVGEHELTIESPIAFFPGAPGWPTPKRPVGVAISYLDIELIR